MVGIFGLGNKASPSRPRTVTTASLPPFQEHGIELPAFGAETTATRVVTTTTHTTTHFFSMPLWRRRASPAHPAAGTPQSSVRPSSDELGLLNGNGLATSLSLRRDKDLPPTPPHGDSGSSSPDITDPTAREHGDRKSRMHRNASATQISPSPSLPAAMQSTSALAESGSQSAFALARAALGIGLPHVMPSSVSASSSTSEVNTVTFGASSSSAHADMRPSSSRMRRAKSFQRDQTMAHDDTIAAADVRERRRTRGLSLGPLQFSSEGKGKQRESDESSPAPPKVVSRKSSFWSRKRNDSQSTNFSNAQTDPGIPRQPSLPKLQSGPIVHHDTSIPLPPIHHSSSSTDLHRRHSERLPSNPPRPSLDTGSGDAQSNISKPTRLARPRRMKRPQTADSAASHRRSSMAYDQPRPPRSSPPPLQPPLPQVEQPAPPVPPPVLAVHAPTVTPRPRSQTNPPLLHRISMNLFGGGSSPSSSLSAPNVSAESVSASPVSSYGSPRPSLSKSPSEIPQPHPDDESPGDYLERLIEAVTKAEVAIALASHADVFHAHALKAYIDRFEFTGDPLDVALRKLLMDVGLPRETQQIDRVIEAFAARYRECNPSLFTSDDHPYILAFSLIMLHTDAFNKSNKRKMTKPDYVKNTRLPGVAPEVLDCFYDNIVFAPFIFIEDPLDVTGQRGLVPETMATRRISTYNSTSPGGHNGSSATLLGKSNKIDPYYLITHDLLDDLRVDVRVFVPPESPYLYRGTGGSWDEDELLRAFVTAREVEIALVESRYLSSPWFGLGVSSAPGPMFSNSIGTSMVLPAPVQTEVSTIKVTKIGLLMRKDDIVEGGRRGMNRKWKEWSILLTGSQLLFFRDPTWATSIQARMKQTGGQPVSPHTVLPQPDELVSVKDAIAVFDKSYTKHSHTLRLTLADGRQFLLQAQGEAEMNEWISRINYASAFKFAGVRMRSLGLSSKDIELTGIAAAASHLRDIYHRATLAASPRIKTWNGPSSEDINLDHDFPPVVETAPSSPVSPRLSKTYSQRRREPSVITSTTSGSGPTTPPSETASRLFKATFDEIKTELATGHWHSLDGTSLRSFHRPRAYSLESTLNSPPMSPTYMSDDSETSRFSSRSQIIRAKVSDLDEKIGLARTKLDSDLRFVQNLAVLTPFQRATRDRVQAAVQGAARRIMQGRLELEKLNCYRDILADDLAAEARDWQRTRKIAMRAATEKLASQHEAVPRMTLSLYLDEANSPEVVSSPRSIPGSSHTSTSSSRAAEESADSSFHSALSVSSTEWPDRHSASAMMADPAHLFDSPISSPLEDVLCSAFSGGAYPFPDVSERPQAATLTTESSMESTSSKTEEHAGHEKFYTAPEMPEEQAEEWNKTRAAKRVSLVRLPSDLRISVLFGKHHRRISEDTASAPSSPRSSMGANPYGRTESTVETVAMLDV